MACRFSHSMCYANAAQLAAEASSLAQGAHPRPRWFCFDLAAVDDVDYSAGQALASLLGTLWHGSIRPVFAESGDEVRTELDRYGIGKAVGDDSFYNSAGDVLRAYDAAPAIAPKPGQGASSHA